MIFTLILTENSLQSAERTENLGKDLFFSPYFRPKIHFSQKSAETAKFGRRPFFDLAFTSTQNSMHPAVSMLLQRRFSFNLRPPFAKFCQYATAGEITISTIGTVYERYIFRYV